MEEEESLILSSINDYDRFYVSNENVAAGSGVDSTNKTLNHAINTVVEVTSNFSNFSFDDNSITTPSIVGYASFDDDHDSTFTINDNDNYWALFALVLVVGTAAGNILVCLAIAWERRLQNVTNYFLMSLAITDLMVAILVMPFGILTLVKGKY